VRRLGLGKAEQRQGRVVGCPDPGAELVRRRLVELHRYPWSSWRVYSGAEPRPGWLETATIEAGCGGRSRAERRAALRAYTEAPVRQGRLATPWEGLVGGVVLGSQEFAQRVLKGRGVDAQEQTAVRRLRRGQAVDWEQVVSMAEDLRGQKWQEMLERYGEWGRDGALYVAVRHGRRRLAELVRGLAGLKYQAAAQAVKRFAASLETNPERRRFVEKMRAQLSND